VKKVIKFHFRYKKCPALVFQRETSGKIFVSSPNLNPNCVLTFVCVGPCKSKRERNTLNLISCLFIQILNIFLWFLL